MYSHYLHQDIPPWLFSWGSCPKTYGACGNPVNTQLPRRLTYYGCIGWELKRFSQQVIPNVRDVTTLHTRSQRTASSDCAHHQGNFSKGVISLVDVNWNAEDREENKRP